MNLIALQELEKNEYHKLYAKIKKGKLKQYKTSNGICFDLDEYKLIMDKEHRGRKPKNATLINPKDIANITKKKMQDFSLSNANYIRTTKLKRYTDEENNTYIDLMEFIKQNIKSIANKTNIPKQQLEKNLYELIKKQRLIEKNSKKGE